MFEPKFCPRRLWRHRIHRRMPFDVRTVTVAVWFVLSMVLEGHFDGEQPNHPCKLHGLHRCKQILSPHHLLHSRQLPVPHHPSLIPGFALCDVRVSGCDTIPYGEVHAMHKTCNVSFPEHFQAFILWIQGFPKGLPTTSLQFLQVSEAASQSIARYEHFQITFAIMSSVDIDAISMSV